MTTSDRNLLDRYVAAQGRTKVPTWFHVWSALSMVSAVVADRVWVTRAPGSAPLRPNLYILLIGPSGIGKGQAIGEAVKLAEPLVKDDLYAGRVSAAGLRDRLGKPMPTASGQWRQPNPRLWFVSEELVFSIRSGDEAFDVISTLVQIYGGSSVPTRDRTRAMGEIAIRRPCVNWLAGTTREWLIRTVKGDSGEGGFGRRVLFIEETDYPEGYPANPEYPPSRDALLASVGEQLQVLQQLGGPFMIAPDAEEAFVEWFENRPGNTDPAVEPWHQSQDELVYKLAMILSLCEAPSLVIERRHMVKAQTLSNYAKTFVARAIDYTTMSSESLGLSYTRRLIRDSIEISETQLARRLAGRGILKRDREEFLATLMAGGEVERTKLGGRKGLWYRWAGRKWVAWRVPGATGSAAEPLDPAATTPDPDDLASEASETR